MPKEVPRPPRVPVRRILEVLAQIYPDVGSGLNFSTPFQCLVATMLSAQCTDRVVNQVTPALFAKMPDAPTLAAAEPAVVEPLIRHVGLYHTKAKNLVAAARLLCEHHGGEVPARMEDLLALPGVGRKTANVVLANAFGLPGLAVDTHVLRVSNRLGLASSRSPEVVERQLKRRVPRAEWGREHHRLIWHGRLVCHARNPECPACPLLPLCRWGKAYVKTQSARSGAAPPRGTRPGGVAARRDGIQRVGVQFDVKS